jgi:hypothetical protein
MTGLELEIVVPATRVISVCELFHDCVDCPLEEYTGAEDCADVLARVIKERGAIITIQAEE